MTNKKDLGRREKKRTIDGVVDAFHPPEEISRDKILGRKGGREDDGNIYGAMRGETAALSRAATCLHRLRIATLRNSR